jgi:hypothetical protein
MKYILHVALQDWKRRNFWAYTQIKNSTIALGATPIGSAGRTPDEIKYTGSYARVKIDFIIGARHQIINSPFTPIGSNLRLVEYTTRRFRVLEQPNKVLDKNWTLKPRPPW